MIKNWSFPETLHVPSRPGYCQVGSYQLRSSCGTFFYFVRSPRKFSTNLEERKLQSIQRVELFVRLRTVGGRSERKSFLLPQEFGIRISNCTSFARRQGWGLRRRCSVDKIKTFRVVYITKAAMRAGGRSVGRLGGTVNQRDWRGWIAFGWPVNLCIGI